MFKKTRELYEARIRELSAQYEARISDWKERVYRAEQDADAKTIIIEDLIDKVLLKHGSTGRKNQAATDDGPPQEIQTQPIIKSVLDDDEEEENKHYRRLQQLAESARTVPDEDRADLLQAAREVELETVDEGAGTT